MITAQQVKQLRDKTQASMADCKKALEESGEDLDKAFKILVRRGKQMAAKRAGKEAKEGILEAYVHSNRKIGVLLELNCETDFVARNEMFKELAHNLAMHVAAMNPKYVSSEEIPEEFLAKEKEALKEELKNSGKIEAVISQIIDGKLKKISDEICLLEQPFVKNPEQKVGDLINEYIGKLGENIRVGRFARYEI